MKEFLSSRERVVRAIEHKPVDRYPIDLGMHFSTGISIFAYINLRKYLGLGIENVELPDTVQMLARVDEDVAQRFHLDTVLLNPKFKHTKKWTPREGYTFNIPEQMNPVLKGEDYFVECGNEKMRMPADGFFFDGSWLQFKDYHGLDEAEYYGKQAVKMHNETDKFTCLMGQFVGFFTGIDMACDMLTDGDTVHEYNKNLLKSQTEWLKHFVKHGGGCVGSIEINSDLGMQNAPMLSPDCYEEFVLPYMKEFIRIIHETTSAKVFLHSCGSIEPLIPHIIESGVDVLNPVQISAKNMEPQMLKDKYGDKISFWGGGCNTQKILPFATPEQVRENVRYLTSIFKKNSGFVFNQVHNIMGNVPPENIVAMFDEAYKDSFWED